MQTTRDAMTYEWAATRVIEIMGAAEAAYIIGKSASLIYAWGDNARPEAVPNIFQAEALDKECQRLCGERPFLQVYAARCGAGEGVLATPLRAFHGWLDGGSSVTREFLRAYDDKELTPRERERIVKKIRRQKARLDELEKSVAGEGAKP